MFRKPPESFVPYGCGDAPNAADGINASATNATAKADSLLAPERVTASPTSPLRRPGPY
jgi:hypothetical protein